jgi:hypothetical protein
LEILVESPAQPEARPVHKFAPAQHCNITPVKHAAASLEAVISQHEKAPLFSPSYC